MADIVRSSFTGTGTSDPITGRYITIQLNFGTGSVDVEELISGTTYIKIPEGTGVIADYTQTYGHPDGPIMTLRLNCTSYTAEIAYVMKAAH